MTAEIVNLIVQAGALGLFAFFLWKIFQPLLSGMMDNLIQATRVQAEMANNLEALCSRLDDADVAQARRIQRMEQAQGNITSSLEEITGVLRGLQQQGVAHEGRAAKRHEIQVEQMKQVVKVLKGMNGHSEE